MTIAQWIALTVIYTCGYWTTYFWYRYLIRTKLSYPWTLQERVIVLVFSLVSWIGIISYGVFYVLHVSNKINLNKEVKW